MTSSEQRFVDVLTAKYSTLTDYVTIIVEDGNIDIYERYVNEITQALHDFIDVEAISLIDVHPEYEYEIYAFDGFTVSYFSAL